MEKSVEQDMTVPDPSLCLMFFAPVQHIPHYPNIIDPMGMQKHVEQEILPMAQRTTIELQEEIVPVQGPHPFDVVVGITHGNHHITACSAPGTPR